MFQPSDTICALSTPSGSGAIGLIRLSGDDAIEIAQQFFKGKNLSAQSGQSLHFGKIVDGEEIVDEVMLSLFRAPHSYTGENLVEISCHGSGYILSRVIELLLSGGARLANPGEFTQRAYLNGKMDLAQAEAVADLIASESKAAHQLALNQMRGGFSEKIQSLRNDLIQFASLIELELDFGEEDVEFANRDDLKALVSNLIKIIHDLVASFATGNVLKNGIPVAIVGQPNVGKSTLLNALLNEEKAIVSEIAGTTRDSIEDEISIGGIRFRFIDTAGIRETEDVIENIGIKRTYQMVDKAMVILYLVDSIDGNKAEIHSVVKDIQAKIEGKEKQLIVLANKVDKGNFDIATIPEELKAKFPDDVKVIYMSALKHYHLDELSTYLRDLAAEKLTGEALKRVEDGLEQNITGDFLAMDIRQALHFLGEITGSIEIDRDILGTIFSQFCIGK